MKRAMSDNLKHRMIRQLADGEFPARPKACQAGIWQLKNKL